MHNLNKRSLSLTKRMYLIHPFFLKPKPQIPHVLGELKTKGKQTKIVENIESVTDSKLSNVEQMEKLIQLRNNGGITPEEFKQMKKEILGK